MKASSTNVKKVFSVVRRVFTILLLVFTVFMMIFTIISVTGIEGDSGLLGYRLYIVLSDSMREDFGVGDIVVARETDVSSLEEGDIISFRSIDPANYDEVITHKIKGPTIYEGQAAYITYGTTTGDEDAYPALASNIQGKFVFSVPKAGYVFQYLRSSVGYVTLIFIPFLLLIVMEGVRFVMLLRKYRGEQQKELAVERALIAEEKKKTEKLIEELSRLQEDFGNKSDSNEQNSTENLDEKFEEIPKEIPEEIFEENPDEVLAENFEVSMGESLEENEENLNKEREEGSRESSEEAPQESLAVPKEE